MKGIFKTLIVLGIFVALSKPADGLVFAFGGCFAGCMAICLAGATGATIATAGAGAPLFPACAMSCGGICSPTIAAPI